MRHLLLLLPLFALAGCQSPQDGVKVTVTSTGFLPGCLQVTARDDASQETRSTALAGKGAPSVGGSVLVGVVLPGHWGTALTITAEAFETPFEAGQDCAGKVVASGNGQVSVVRGEAAKGNPPGLTLALSATDEDGDGYVPKNDDGTGGTDCDDRPTAGASVHPGAKENCNDRDDNCDGDDDQTHFKLGVACENDGGCTGRLECAFNKVDTTCKAPEPEYAWVDGDDDKVGKAGVEPTRFCAPSTVPDAGYVPFSARHDDCDDGNKNIHPLATEACNGADDNCDGTPDNIAFEDCMTPDSQCVGARQCKGIAGDKECVATVPVPTWYPDSDLDGKGRTNAGIASCSIQAGAGYITASGDCDDGNPFIHATAPELCDEQDNNCDGQTDENQVCGTTAPPRWVGNQIGTDSGRTWYGISLYGNGGVWLSGSDSGRGVKKPGEADFTLRPGACAGNARALHAVWAHPGSGKAYMGGTEERLLIQEDSSTVCGPQPSLNSNSNDTVTYGLLGFVSATDPDEVLLYGVATEGNLNDGATFRWNGEVNTVAAPRMNDTPLKGIHGLSPDLMFAVGSFKNPSSSGPKGRILRYQPGSTSWGDLKEPAGAKGLNAVWVVHSKLAYAVGDNGTFLQWDGTSWALAPSPSGGENLNGVMAFGSNAIYVASASGTLYRYYDGIWHPYALHNASLTSIRGTRPDDLWTAGAQGKAFHYPAWPTPALP
ncbi:MAG: hypothetical protein EOO71_08740 [Myxococcaceae bacterium]|nr:MAG: hypothetical protein EOO71_08740 [Myxococcaceae bacterium]